jgi:endonuclease/exonuclease/phosphatase family metal-dependent hydrolase
LMTYNLKDWGTDPAGQADRYRLVERVISNANPTVLMVQELMTPRPPAGFWMSPDQKWQHRVAHAPALVQQLADATGLAVPIVDGRAAVGIGSGDRHTAILHHPDTVTVKAGSVRAFGPEAHVWHSIIAGEYTIATSSGPKDLVIVSAHLDPFSSARRTLDAAQVARAINLNYAGPTPPGFVGADWNSLGASSRDHDPYRGVDWNPVFALQLAPDGQVDRSTGQYLEECGLRDCADLHQAALPATAGHYPGDPHPPRRIDRIYATADVPREAITAVAVIDTPLAREASDHLPVIVDIDTDHLPSTALPR